jgi:predicted ATPase
VTAVIRTGDEHRRALGIGLSGAHRTGKTTVARRFAEVNECPLILSSATSVAKDMGIKVDIGMPIADRMAFQEEVLRRFEDVYETQAGNGLFIADRTPLDFAAYMLTDWHPVTSGSEHNAQIIDYVQRCMTVTERYFYLVSVVQPGIAYVSGDGKPAPNDLYQELLNTTLIGLAADTLVRNHFYLMPRTVTENEERCSHIGHVYSKKISEYHNYLAEVLPQVH